MKVKPLPGRDLNHAVYGVIEQRLANGKIVDRREVTDEVLDSFPIPDFEGADFYVGWAARGIDQILCKYVTRLKREQEEEGVAKQVPLLPGFKRLQTHYPVTRKGQTLLVPITDLTSLEIQAKVEQFVRASEGNKEHAIEFVRWHELNLGPMPVSFIGLAR
jgi:hypothetical protein